MISVHDPRPFLIVDRELATESERGIDGSYCIDLHVLDHLVQHGPAWKAYNSKLVEEVVQNPQVIFRDLRRDNFQNAVSYCGRTDYRFDEHGGQIAFPDDEVFLAFATLLPEELVFFDWEFRKQDPNKQGFPINWTQDFGDPEWQRQ